VSSLYFSDVCASVKTVRPTARARLRSTNRRDLIFPCTTTLCFGPWSSRVSAPISYELPPYLKYIDSSRRHFKAGLKPDFLIVHTRRRRHWEHLPYINLQLTWLDYQTKTYLGRPLKLTYFRYLSYAPPVKNFWLRHWIQQFKFLSTLSWIFSKSHLITKQTFQFPHVFRKHFKRISNKIMFKRTRSLSNSICNTRKI